MSKVGFCCCFLFVCFFTAFEERMETASTPPSCEFSDNLKVHRSPQKGQEIKQVFYRKRGLLFAFSERVDEQSEEETIR